MAEVQPVDINGIKESIVATGPEVSEAATKDMEAVSAELEADAPTSLLKAAVEYEPSIPSAVTKHYLDKAGCVISDPVLLKVITIAAQKFVGDLAMDTRDRAFFRNQANLKSSHSHEVPRTTLKTEDLAKSLRQRGLQVSKPPYLTS